MTETKQQSILEQLGGISGLIYSTLPILVFVPVNGVWGLGPAIWAALGVAVAILVWRLVRHSPIQPAVSGFFGVGISAFIAYRTGDAKGYFLFGIYTSLAYGAVFLLSILVRWPLVGLIWGFLNGHGNLWRRIVARYGPTTWPLAPGRWCSRPATSCSRNFTIRTRPGGSRSRASRWAGRWRDWRSW